MNPPAWKLGEIWPVTAPNGRERFTVRCHDCTWTYSQSTFAYYHEAEQRLRTHVMRSHPLLWANLTNQLALF